MRKILANDFFDLSFSVVGEYLKKEEPIYVVFTKLDKIIKQAQKSLGNDFLKVKDDVYIHKDARIAPSATIIGPAIIDKGAEIRNGAFIRGNAVIGKGAVIGNSTEVKNSIVFDFAQCPHFNYVGDSIIGYKGHLGAGVILSNFRLDHGNISISYDGNRTSTELRKLGAIIGDGAEIGCNSVINPGSVIHKGSVIYPLSRINGEVRGIYK